MTIRKEFEGFCSYCGIYQDINLFFILQGYDLECPSCKDVLMTNEEMKAALIEDLIDEVEDLTDKIEKLELRVDGMD